SLPLKENDEVRAATRRDGFLARALSSSSASPSEKYSLSASPLMFTKGRTAIEATLVRAAAGDASVGLPAPVPGFGPLSLRTNQTAAVPAATSNPAPASRIHGLLMTDCAVLIGAGTVAGMPACETVAEPGEDAGSTVGFTPAAACTGASIVTSSRSCRSS